MPKPRQSNGDKNLISRRLVELRKQKGLSQRALAYQLQLLGYDIDKNTITRIENNHRYVTDIELNALSKYFDISCDCLVDSSDDDLI